MQKLGPAFLFWGGGVLTWILGGHWLWRQLRWILWLWDYLRWLRTWKIPYPWGLPPWDPLHPGASLLPRVLLDNQVLQFFVVVVGGLFFLSASTAVVERLQLPALRLLEGYWPRPFQGLRFRLARWRGEQQRKKDERWQALADIPAEERTAEQQEEYANLDAELTRYPVNSDRLLPTALGNILRAAEEYPWTRYGLSVSVCWPRLWLILPKEARETLAHARQRLNGAVRLFIWGVLFLVWTLFAWWAVLVALVLCIAAYWAALQAAGTYGDLLRSAFDLYRFDLYEQVRWPPPTAPTGEEAHGRKLSEYLFRGTGGDGVQFVKDEK